MRSPVQRASDAVIGAHSAAKELLGILSQDPFDHDALALAEQSAGIGVWSIDLTSGMVRATAQFFRIMGLEPTRELVPIETIRSLRHPEDRERVVAGFNEAIESGMDAYEIEYRIIRPDGNQRWIFGRGRVVRDAAGKPLRYSGIDLDITDRKAAEAALAAAKEELEELNRTLEERVRRRTIELESEAQRRMEAETRLHQAQKMEAIGQLTSGIAHDFNNILQVIQGNLDVARLSLERENASQVLRERLCNALETAQRASGSARQLVQRMLGFSRQQTLQPVTIDANALILEMADMVQRLVGETIEVRTVAAREPAPIFADRNQLESALLNLVVNARDAMENGGRLVIETGHGSPDGVPQGEAADAYVLLRVTDTGCGIPATDLKRIFEPFFTTKGAGKGSGLGLSMVSGFVKQSHGHVRVRSEVGVGTSVSIYLPQAPPESKARKPAALADGANKALARARPGETVLIVEDDHEVRRLGVSALESLGYRVYQASDARSALELLDRIAGLELTLLFIDVVLPGIGASVVVDAAKARMPGIRVAYTSGYTSDPALEKAELEPGARVLDKPYTIEALASFVRLSIDSREG